jgi:hypothetical protein
VREGFLSEGQTKLSLEYVTCHLCAADDADRISGDGPIHRFAADKLRCLNPTVSRMAEVLLGACPALAKRSIYVNPGDEMIVCARKALETV